MEMAHVIVVVKDYDATVLAVKVQIDKVPASGEKIEVNFDDPKTEIIGGKWGEESAKGIYSFTVHETTPADGLYTFPTIVCLLQISDEDTA
jgi:hypothetical protein